MKKRVFFAIVSIVVFPFSLLLYTSGNAGIPETPSTMARVPVPADVADNVEWKQLHNPCRSQFQINASGNNRRRLQGCSASKHSMPLLANFDASPWPQRSETSPGEAGEDIPGSQKKAFLLNVDKAVFACSEDACDHYFRQCGLDIDYTLYSGPLRTAVNEAVIICRAKIVYQTKGGYHLNSEAGPETSHHALKNKAQHSSRLSLHFHFSEYEQVTEVQLDKFKCRVHPGNYIPRVTEALID